MLVPPNDYGAKPEISQIGGSEWESNPPVTGNLPPAGFEDRDDHRTACASTLFSITYKNDFRSVALRAELLKSSRPIVHELLTIAKNIRAMDSVVEEARFKLTEKVGGTLFLVLASELIESQHESDQSIAVSVSHKPRAPRC